MKLFVILIVAYKDVEWMMTFKLNYIYMINNCDNSRDSMGTDYVYETISENIRAW